MMNPWVADVKQESLNVEQKQLTRKIRGPRRHIDELNNLVSFHMHDLMSKHSNLEMIGSSEVKSIGYGTERHQIEVCPCVVLYCRLKSYIPIGETPFPAKLSLPDGFTVKTDVREGYFTLCPNNESDDLNHNEFDLELLTGQSVGLENRIQTGTIGPFVQVNSKDPFVGFITAAHTLSDNLDNINSTVNMTVVSPACGEIEARHCSHNTRCGDIVACSFIDNKDVGIDAALVKINKDRIPEHASFIEVSVEALMRTDLLRGSVTKLNEATCFPNDDIHHTTMTKVIKFGCKTGLTEGYLNHKTRAIKVSQYSSDGKTKSYVMSSKLEVGSHISKLFMQKGDSGAAVIHADIDNNFTVIGIAIGMTSDGFAIVTPIQDIIKSFSDELGCEIKIENPTYNVNAKDEQID